MAPLARQACAEFVAILRQYLSTARMPAGPARVVASRDVQFEPRPPQPRASPVGIVRALVADTALRHLYPEEMERNARGSGLANY